MSLERANPRQKEAIVTTEGPVLIIAGPGTGKTYTLVNRIIYLITEKSVKPEEIMISTFTDKAAKELITRITNELEKIGVAVNIQEMYIGTFHSICARIIKENASYTNLQKNYRMLEGFEQLYMVFKNIARFQGVEAYQDIIGSDQFGKWKQAQTIIRYTSSMIEEMVDIEEMKRDSEPRLRGLAQLLEVYHALSWEENVIDFSTVQTEAYRLLLERPEILDRIQEQVKYIMVDEYQDTNNIQEKIVFKLGSKYENICVVGDDDQGLYRFRGATIQNIMDFPHKFQEGKCKQIKLVTNYRSDKGIIDFYNNWMDNTNVPSKEFAWKNNRYPKTIEAGCPSQCNQPSVIKCRGINSNIEWYEQVYKMIESLKENETFVDYNQVAFICSSVKDSAVIGLINFLEEKGINAYSPRSGMFFQRKEIQEIIGCMLYLYPSYYKKLLHDKDKVPEEVYNYYNEKCIPAAKKIIREHQDSLGAWVGSVYRQNESLKGKSEFIFSQYLYQLFAFEPFKSYLGVAVDDIQKMTRPARNLANFVSMIARYEDLEGVRYISDENIGSKAEGLFSWYMLHLFNTGADEYEDQSEYAPSGCVSFLTIHQSKGMEFPVVLVDSLKSNPFNRKDVLLDMLSRKYFSNPSKEEEEDIKYYDHWRSYYTAFSRPQNLLVLTCNESNAFPKIPNITFRKGYDDIPDYDNVDLTQYKFEVVKSTNLKNAYSFTSHIAIYAKCPLQYKFFKELGFKREKNPATMFGTLVHETIEDINNKAIAGEIDAINQKNVEQWFATNYETLVKFEKNTLGEVQRNAALRQVIRYMESHHGEWDTINESEIDVSMVNAQYILRGAVDMVRSDGDMIELVDFKSEKKPDEHNIEVRAGAYRKQLNVYAHLIEKQTGKKVSKLHIYYTGEPGDDQLLTFDKDESEVESVIGEFGEIVSKIENREFIDRTDNKADCKKCEFRYYCQRG